MNQGDEYISDKGRGVGIHPQIIGVDESIFEGKVTPIEFKTMEIADSIMDYGLDSFITMIRYLSANYAYLTVSVNLVFIPTGRKFSYLHDGRRRVCVIVKVIKYGKVSYILEVVVPDNYSLSTLIIPSVGRPDEDEQHIRSLLKNLVYSSGSWSRSFLHSIQHIKIRHLQENFKNWAQRLENSL